MRRAPYALLLLACGGAPEPVSPAVVEAKEAAPIAPPPPRIHARTLPPLAPDVVPERLGTPASSLAARPYFGYGGWAPQLDPPRAIDLPALVHDPCAVWNDAPSQVPDGPIRGGDMLVCKAVTDRVERKFDFWRVESTTKADVDIEVTLVPPKKSKETFAMEAQGPDDLGRACITLPVIDIDKGWALEVHAKDRGVFSDDADLGTFRIPFDPSRPVAGGDAHFGVECRRVSRSTVEERIKQGLAALDAAIDTLDRSLLVELDDVGWGRLPLIRARGPLDWVAAWSGWDDLRLRARIDRLVLLERRLDAEIHEALTKSDFPKGLVPVRAEGLSIEASVLSCGDKRFEAVRGKKDDWARGKYADLACVLGLRVRNDGDKTRDLGFYETRSLEGIDITLLDTTGRAFMLSLVGTMKDGAVRPLLGRDHPRAEPGEIVELLFNVSTNELVPHTMYEPPPPKLVSNPASLEPFALEVHAPRHGLYDPTPQRFRVRVPVPL